MYHIMYEIQGGRLGWPVFWQPEDGPLLHHNDVMVLCLFSDVARSNVYYLQYKLFLKINL